MLAVPARLTVAQGAAVLAAAVGGVIVFAVFVRPEDLGSWPSGFRWSPRFRTLTRWRSASRSAMSMPAWAIRGGSQVLWLTYGLALHNGPIIVVAAAKGGTTALADVVEYAGPVNTKGFVVMDTPGVRPGLRHGHRRRRRERGVLHDRLRLGLRLRAGAQHKDRHQPTRTRWAAFTRQIRKGAPGMA